ncbi:MAG: site-specific integrase [Planctomycetes bacterium]|nr:site-specific integrase [Planctomycetota bacterium]
MSKDKSVAEAELNRELLNVERRKAGLPVAEDVRSVGTLQQHLEGFLCSLRADNRTERYVRQCKTRLTRILKLLDGDTVAALRLDKIQGALAGLLAGGCSVKTRDHYASLVRQFGSWLEAVGAVLRNPALALRRVSTEADAQVDRYALKPEELEKLLRAAEERPVEAYRRTHPGAGHAVLDRFRFEGQCRAAIYAVAATSGLRRNELKQLRWSDLTLAGEHPKVRVRAKVAKSRKSAELPLTPAAATYLREHLSRIHSRLGRVPKPQEVVFRIPNNLVERLRSDAAWARIEVPKGMTLDFHSLRATCGTLLARAGVPVQYACRLLRHSDVRITMKIYTKLDGGDLEVAQAALGRFLESQPTALLTASLRPTEAAAGTRWPNKGTARIDGSHD